MSFFFLFGTSNKNGLITRTEKLCGPTQHKIIYVVENHY